MKTMSRMLASAVAVAILAVALCGASEARSRHPSRKAQDDVTIVEQTRLRAMQGDARAQTQLGFLYATGRGVPQDRVEAANWYALAAAQGNADGQYLLGMAYDKGHGVVRDAVLAYKWINLAAARADKRARKYYALMRDAIASKLTAAQLDQGQWLATQWQPSRLN